MLILVPAELAASYQLRLTNERIRVPELLFQPALVGVDCMGVSETLAQIYRAAPKNAYSQLTQVAVCSFFASLSFTSPLFSGCSLPAATCCSRIYRSALPLTWTRSCPQAPSTRSWWPATRSSVRAVPALGSFGIVAHPLLICRCLARGCEVGSLGRLH